MPSQLHKVHSEGGGVAYHRPGRQAGEGLRYPVEVDDADVTQAPLDAPTKSCGRRSHQAE
jgi:hypothetical protein